jgi:hypothetical protein
MNELNIKKHQTEIDELKFMLKVATVQDGCSKYCKHGYSVNTYPECKLDWCDHWEKFELDKEKFNYEYRYEIAKAKGNEDNE